MNTRQSRFAGVLNWREHHGTGAWPDVHPIDGVAMAFAEVARSTVGAAPRAITGDLVLCAVSPAGNREASEVLVEAGLYLHVPAACAGAEAFHVGVGGQALVRVGWKMAGGRTAPDVSAIQAEVMAFGPEWWALQFIRESGHGGASRQGTLLGGTATDFGHVEGFTLGVGGWHGPPGELLLMFDRHGLATAPRAVREAALR